MHSLQDWIAALDAHGLQPHARGGEWHGGCPACGGAKRFHVRAGDSQPVLAQCRECQIPFRQAEAMLFEARDEPQADHLLTGFRPSAPAPGAPNVHPPKGVPGDAERTEIDWFDPLANVTVIQTRWDWIDADGTPDKACRWPTGTKTAGLIYPACIDHERPILVLTEGAKAADAVSALGCAAIGVTDASTKIGADTLRTVTQGRVVVVWPDADDQGRALARRLVTRCEAAGAASVAVLDPALLPDCPDPLPKGWDAADWMPAPDLDTVHAIQQAAGVGRLADLVALDTWDPDHAIPLPNPVIALGEHGNPLPMGETAILAGSGGEGKSRLSLQWAIAAAAADDSVMVCPFSGQPLDATGADPFTVGSTDQLTIRGGPVVMVSWEDRPPWLAHRARIIAAYLDTASGTTRHAKVIRNSDRIASMALGYSEPLFGVMPEEAFGTTMHSLAGWARLWDTVDRVKPSLIVVDPINLATCWEGYSPTSVGLFIGALRERLTDAAILLVGHTGKAAAKSEGDPSPQDVLGSMAWTQRCRATFIMTRDDTGVGLHLVKANYAAKVKMQVSDVAQDGAFQLGESDEFIRKREKVSAEFREKVLDAIPTAPDRISATAICEIVIGKRGGSGVQRIKNALDTLKRSGDVDQTAPTGRCWSKAPGTGIDNAK